MKKRSSSRIKASVPVEVKIVDSKKKISSKITGKILDISEKGTMLALKKALPYFSEFTVCIKFPDKYTPIEVPSRVIWSDSIAIGNKFYSGIQFLKLNEKQLATLREFIKSEKKFISRTLYKTRKIFEADFVSKRREFISKQVGVKLHHIGHYRENPKNMQGTIENLIGCCQIPLGITGPVRVDGPHARGEFYIPVATTEGTLVDTYQRGIITINKSGGANAVTVSDKLNISPAFALKDIKKAVKFRSWVSKNFQKIKRKAEETTRHGKLLEIKPYMLGRRVLLNFCYYTGDAMGLNMINIATSHACEYIISENADDVERFYLRSNLSSDKKASFFNLITGYGKEVLAEVTIPRKIAVRYLGSAPEKIYDFCATGILGGIQAGMIGANAHFANGLAAVFLACGQDIAQIINASIGMSIPEVTQEGNLYISLKLPNLIIGTVGGGTKLDAQRESLEIMGCYGAGKAKKFAEILAVFLLAGEISIYAALATGGFINAHIINRKIGQRI